MTDPRPGRNTEDLRVRPFVGSDPSAAPTEPPIPMADAPPPPASSGPVPSMSGPIPTPRPAPEEEPEARSAGDAGVRPYLLTGGRTRSGHLAGGFETLVVVTELGQERAAASTPEQRGMLAAAAKAVSIAELSARLRLPLGVAQVLAGDLVGFGYLAQYATPDDAATDPVLLRRLIKAVEGI